MSAQARDLLENGVCFTQTQWIKLLLLVFFLSDIEKFVALISSNLSLADVMTSVEAFSERL